MRRFKMLVVASAMLLGMSASVWAQQSPRPREGDLKVGDAAPDFAVSDVQGKMTVKLSDLKGKPVVLIFGSCT